MNTQDHFITTIPRSQIGKMAIAYIILPATLIAWMSVIIWTLLLLIPATKDFASSLADIDTIWWYTLILLLPTGFLLWLDDLGENFPHNKKCSECGSFFGWRAGIITQKYCRKERVCLSCKHEETETDHQ